GRAFGLQRAMDHTGAVIGPLLASTLLWSGLELRMVFALAAIPALASVIVLVTGVREAARSPQAGPDDAARAGAALPSSFLRYLAVLAVFTLGNSSDAFLLLR